jgi:hypothetical protein
MTTMKLSEAIRLGAMLKPQRFGGLYVDSGTCALGAAMDAIGALPKKQSVICSDAEWEPALRLWGGLLDRRVAHPVNASPEDLVCHVITNLNDSHKWTREQIADWVETIEVAQAVAGADQGGAMHGASIQETLIGTSPQR